MNQAQIQLSLPLILTIFANLMVVVFAAWLNTRALTARIDGLEGRIDAKIDALRAEMKQGFAEVQLEMHTELGKISATLDRLEDRVGRLEEQRTVLRP